MHKIWLNNRSSSCFTKIYGIALCNYFLQFIYLILSISQTKFRAVCDTSFLCKGNQRASTVLDKS